MIPNLMLINLISAKMAQQFIVNCVYNDNSTLKALKDPKDETYVTFTIYQTHPNQISGLDVLAWQKVDVFPGGQEAVTWNETYNAYLTKYVDNPSVGKIYSSSQRKTASFKDEFIVADEQGIQYIQKKDSSSEDNTISILNTFVNAANIGLGMDDSLALGIADVPDINTIFKISPIYYLNVYTNLILGQVISSVGLIGDSRILQFPPNKSLATATLTKTGQVFDLKIEYFILPKKIT
ncbi:hypothetical protein RclHR1_25120002 [Rhizophagus clarus]|uniref:Uncharacterized protein n=1 Tax=Rhizophagus clarus TaxID=94130 RepID=A0A2Z6RTS0_9GLOM|nr:hypothetical protein RclHR1_25120002 [Rhizophagus clarus]GET00561.1 hypothetical protein GLOIN_2v1772597 [Rhizophagus clarus]